MIEVLSGGLLTSLQDAGRCGHAHLGIGRAGAADAPALRLANALVGNGAGACALEMTLQGPRLRLHRDAWVALTGAPLPQARCDDQPLPMWRPVRCAAGSELALGAMPVGCRSYLAVAGGIEVEPWLGSRATDINAGLGPLGRALRKGDRLPVGQPAAGIREASVGHWSLDPRPWFYSDPARPLGLLPGSHRPAMDEASARSLVNGAFVVAADSNRVGIRLQGPGLRLREPVEMVSEGLVPGVVQLPPGGQPIVMMCEHPVTGGYPRIGQVAAVDLPSLAQRRPGETVRFAWATLGEARQALDRREQLLRRLGSTIARRLADMP